MAYVVATAFTHLGRAYAPGEPIEPKPTLIGQLVAAGCIKEVPPPLPVDPAPAVKAEPAPSEVLAAVKYEKPSTVASFLRKGRD